MGICSGNINNNPMSIDNFSCFIKKRLAFSCDNNIREMLTNALRAFVNEPFKKSFYGKKNAINVLTVFSIFHKSSIKTFL